MAKRSLYEYIESSLVNGELPSDFSLPYENEDGVVWADGAMDGVMIYHMTPSELSEENQILMEKAVKAASAHEFDTADELFSQIKDNVRALSLIDPMQNYIYENKKDMNPGNILFYAAHLIMEEDNKELVKYGLSMLELISTEGDENLQNVIRTLGLSDEFTLFSVFVMRNWLFGNDDIFELAKKVHGWGRIHTVARLRPDTEEIRHWLLTEGVHNNVMPAYSAVECWQKSNAEEKLFSQLTYEEYQGIRDIIEGLLDEGPVNGISMLEDPDHVLAQFLKQSEKHAAAADDYIAVDLIKNHLEDENAADK